MRLHKSLKIFGKDDQDISLEVPRDFREPDEEDIKAVRRALAEKGKRIAELIEGKVMLGKAEEGHSEYEVVMIPELLEALKPICASKFDNPDALEHLLKSIAPENQDYILVEKLEKLFSEKAESGDESGSNKEEDESLLEDAEELDSRALELARKIASYLKERKLTALELFEDIVFQQEVSVDGKNVTVDVMKAKEFYRLLKEIGITRDKESSLSEFLALSKDYPKIFIVKKMLKLIDYVKSKDNNDNNKGK